MINLTKTMSHQEAFSFVLIILTFVLFTTSTLFNVPMLLMCLLAVIALARSPKQYLTPTRQPILFLFALIWAPMLLSLPDAVNFGQAAEKTASYFLLFFFCLFVVNVHSGEKMKSLCFYAINFIILFFLIDATIQFFLGKNLFGYPYTAPQLNGMFYPSIRLPYFLAVFAPLFFEFLRLHAKKNIVTALAIAWFLLIILLGGKRTAWIMLVFSSAGYFFYLYHYINRVDFRKIAFVAVCLFVSVFLLYSLHPATQKRILKTTSLIEATSESIDKATAYRLSLWEVAVNIGKKNWINGIGPRGFRSAFVEYADKENFWLQKRRSGQTHPHQITLEIFSETGLIGLAGYIVFLFWLGCLLRKEIREGNVQIVPWYLCIFTAFLPLNSHLAFYGSYWSSVSWWILSLTLMLSSATRNETNTNS